MSPTPQRALAALSATVLLTAIANPVPAAAAEPVTVSYASTGTEQVFDVPTGVSSVHVILIGGPGGDYVGNTTGGFGARVEGNVAVMPGTTLYIEVGGPGADVALAPTPGGFNGGGAGGVCGPDAPGSFRGASGGGASDIRTIARTQVGTLSSRLMVAGGGGGAGDIGPGGNAGASGGAARAGGGASAMAGGIGGAGDVAGQTGTLGLGGVGATTAVGGCGAGGGGGSFGGGGGGASATDGTAGGSGGGGSSDSGTATNASTTTDATGIASITISYLVPVPDLGTVAAAVSVPTSTACLELSATSISFGTLPLGSADQPATPDVTVTNCSGLPASLLASGTNATGIGASWALVNGGETCATTLGLDRYRLLLETAAFPAPIGLSTDATTLTTLAAGQSSAQTARIFMACPGSTGGGQTMGMSINYLAVGE